jgi:hypothetical protein
VTRSFASLLGFVLVASPGAAYAAPSNVDTCANAYEEAQRQQARGALLEAREQVKICAAAACPAGIVPLCAALADDLDRTIPTIVVAPVDAEGRDVAGARLVIDGEEPGVPLDGRAIPMNPGAHGLRVVSAAPGVAPVEVDVTLLAGERNRRVEARLADEAAAPSGPAEPAAGGGASLTVPAIVALSVGGVGLGVGAVTGILALGEDSTLSDRCETESTCPPTEQDRIDRAGTFATVSTVGFVIGVVGVATGVVLLVVGGDDEAPRKTSADARGLTVRF